MEFYYSNSPLILDCSDSELESIIDNIIRNKKLGDFSFSFICEQIMVDAKENDRNYSQCNVIYPSQKLAQSEINRISKILWKMIWEQKLFFDFANTHNEYVFHVI